MNKLKVLWTCPICRRETESSVSIEEANQQIAAECPECRHVMIYGECTHILGVVRENITQSSKSEVWLTPPSVWEPARALMGGTIDLDPCAESLGSCTGYSSETPSGTEFDCDIGDGRTCEECQYGPYGEGDRWNVPARIHWTKADDALSQPTWMVGDEPIDLFMNPPYNKSRIQNKFVDRFLHELSLGRIGRAVILLASRTDTKWYQKLYRYPRCHVRGRLKFLKPGPNGPVERGPATFPSVIFGVGIDPSLFWGAYHHLGGIYIPYVRGRYADGQLVWSS